MRFGTETQKIDGWEISFRNNVHMYCHSLSVAKGKTKIDISCEDTPEGHIGVWLMDLGRETPDRDALISVLTKFFTGLEKACKIYSPDGEVVS